MRWDIAWRDIVTCFMYVDRLFCHKDEQVISIFTPELYVLFILSSELSCISAFFSARKIKQQNILYALPLYSFYCTIPHSEGKQEGGKFIRKQERGNKGRKLG